MKKVEFSNAIVEEVFLNELRQIDGADLSWLGYEIGPAAPDSVDPSVIFHLKMRYNCTSSTERGFVPTRIAAWNYYLETGRPVSVVCYGGVDGDIYISKPLSKKHPNRIIACSDGGNNWFSRPLFWGRLIPSVS